MFQYTKICICLIAIRLNIFLLNRAEHAPNIQDIIACHHDLNKWETRLEELESGNKKTKSK